MIWVVRVSLCKVAFMFLVGAGVVLAIVSKSVFSIWCSMEVSFFGVIPLLVGGGCSESEAGFKYFMVQVMGSSLMLTSLLSTLGSVYVGYFLMLFLVFGLFLKLGVFPLHSWFPSVVGSSSWMGCFLLLVVQKVPPYWFISGMGLPICVLLLFLVSAAFTSVLGSIGGLNQINTRALLGYSSLSHSGWLMGLSFFDFYYFCVYFLLYSFIVAFILSMSVSLGNPLVLGLYFLSLGGLPPFLGSVGKFLGVKALIGASSMLCGVLVFSSMISLGYYVWFLIRLMIDDLPKDSKGGAFGYVHGLFNLLWGPLVLSFMF